MKRIVFFIFLICSIYGFSQNKKPKKVKNINAERVDYSPKKYRKHYLFSGKVIFDHEGTKFYCDSAVHFTHNNSLLAWGKVKIKNDTIELKGDSLKYNGQNKVSEMWENVRLKDRQQTITADYMRYNRNNDVAEAKGNVVVIDKDRTTKTERVIYNRRNGVIRTPEKTFIKNKDGSTIESNSSVYNSFEKTNTFKGNVKVVDKDYIITSDQIKYNQKNGDVHIYSNTKIVSRENPADYIVTSKGIFNRNSGIAKLYNRSTVYNDGKVLIGDYIEYNEKTGFGKARGNVELREPAENRWIKADYIEFDEKTGLAKARGNVYINDVDEGRWIKGDYGESYEKQDSAFVTGNAYAVKAFEEDSLYFHADTIMAVQRLDSTRLIRGYRKAKFFKSNVQGKADSISYNEKDGRLNFYRNPIVWSGDQQITGDTIFVYTNTEKEVTDSIRVFKNAFVISKVDSIPEHKEYHQVKGRRLLAIFFQNKLKWIEIEGNSQSLTFMDEEKRDSLNVLISRDRIGINRSDCGIIEAQVEANNVDILACKIEATSKLYPEKDLPEKQRFLPDFNWKGAERMKTWRDMFIDFDDSENFDDVDFDNLNEIPVDKKPKVKPKANPKGTPKKPSKGELQTLPVKTKGKLDVKKA